MNFQACKLFTFELYEFWPLPFKQQLNSFQVIKGKPEPDRTKDNQWTEYLLSETITLKSHSSIVVNLLAMNDN